MSSKLQLVLPLLLVTACHIDGHYVDIDGGMDADAPQPADNAADLVLGQPNFSTSEPNSGGASERSLNYPYGIAATETSLWVADGGNARVLRWETPQNSFAPALQILGRSSFTDISDFTGATDKNLQKTCCGAGVAIGGTKLIVADPLDNRVLVWNPLPTSNGQAVSFVLGQISPTCCSLPGSGNGAGQLKYPNGVWTDGTRLAISDSGNNRVLIWTAFPTTNGQPADIVLGQNAFGQSASPMPPTASSMAGPKGVYSDGVRFYVADTDNNRVLVWTSFPTTNGQAADFVIGQTAFSGSGGGASRAELALPTGIVSNGSKLFVADYGNNRIVVFDPIPMASGAAAAGLFGQVDFGMRETPCSAYKDCASRTNLNSPAHLSVVGNSLYVTDSYQSRVLRFDL